MLIDTPPVFPVTVGGWVALALSISACLGLFLTWGRLLQKFDDLKGDVEELKKKNHDIETLEGDVVVLQHTIWGPKGDNGISSEVRKLRSEVNSIADRNRVIDALNERERGARIVGHEERLLTRRREDQILRDEDK